LKYLDFSLDFERDRNLVRTIFSKIGRFEKQRILLWMDNAIGLTPNLDEDAASNLSAIGDRQAAMGRRSAI
jgi:hypothetical protein